DGKVVYYEVTDTGLVLREATAAERAALESSIARGRRVELPLADVTSPRLAMLGRMRARDVVRYGTKAANLGEAVTAKLEGVAVPPGFGVPFFYYVQHMKRNKLDARVEAVLADPRYKDPVWRRAALDELRQAIVAAPIDPAVLDMLYKRVQLKL